MKKRFFHRHPGLTLVIVVLLFYLLCDVLIEKTFMEQRTFRIPHPYYHHDLKKSYQGNVQWGGTMYPFFTNSLGFRDREKRKIDPGNAAKNHRIVLIGDSFVEGMGLPYQQTFAGHLDGDLSGANIEILNAGVLTYSPKLYYLKIDYLINKVNLKFNELYVFIDISDIQDEIFYESFDPTYREPIISKVDRFIGSFSFTYELIKAHLIGSSAGYDGAYNGRSIHKCRNKAYTLWKTPEDYWKERSQWTYNMECYKKWGVYGLRLAREQMDKLHELCQNKGIKMTIIVYPYPGQIRKRDLDSIQVRVWKKFSEERALAFIDLFPCFINDTDADIIIDRYYIRNDCHWNSEGNRYIGEVLSSRISRESMPKTQ
jgi:hypothetical protein